MRCSDQQLGHPDRICMETDEHTGPHRDEWGVQWNNPTTDVGFTREELTAAAARQQKVAPSKDEVLAAIRDVDADRPGLAHHLGKAMRAVEKLYADRGL